MIYVENTSNYPQRVYIPRDEGNADDTRGYQFQKKDLDISQNGDYYLYPDPGYDGITASTIHVEVPTDTQEAYNQGYQDGYAAGYASGSTDGYASGHTDGYAEGYSSGHTDGYAEGYASGHTDGYAEGYAAGYEAGFAAGAAAQKAKLVPLTATTNGHYSTEDGYSDVYVNVEGGGDYSSGYTDGMAAQKALLTSTTFTDNGHFEREDGWNAIDVRLNLPSLHTAITENGRVVYLPPAGAKGFDSVEIDVNVPQTGGTGVLSSLTVTENGNYAPEQGVDGFSAVTVNVPQTGSTLTAITATTNGEYYPAQYSAQGFSQVTVAVDTASTYQEGYEDGEAAQKALLGELTATTNGRYESADGYSGVTVDVPTPKLIAMSTTIANNGTHTFDPADFNADGFGYMTINVDVSPASLGVLGLRYVFEVPSTANTMQGYTTSGPVSGWYAQEFDGTVDVCGASIRVGSGETKQVSFFTSNYTTTPIPYSGTRGRIVEAYIEDVIQEGPYNWFQDCNNLRSVSLSKNLTSIPDYAFRNCTSLTEIIIPSGVTALGVQCLAGCSAMVHVWCAATTAPNIRNRSAFLNISTTGTLHVPVGSDYSAWLAELGSGWSIDYRNDF